MITTSLPVISVNQSYLETEFKELFPQELFDRYARKASEVVYGRTRVVFLLSNFVVKLPLCFAGCTDNDWEGSVSNTEKTRDNQDYIQYPHTRLIQWKDIPVLFMSKVTEPEQFSNLPDWILSVDAMQVGYTKQGRLVAYDYGLT